MVNGRDKFIVKWESPKTGRTHQSRKRMSLGEAKYVAATANKSNPDINHWVEQVDTLEFKNRF